MKLDLDDRANSGWRHEVVDVSQRSEERENPWACSLVWSIVPWQNAQLSENQGTTMTKIIITAIIALASIGAHAQVTYKTSFDCAKASTYSERAMCEDKALADADLAYWKVFQAARNAATDKQAFHNHAITAFKYRQQCADRECIVTWFKEQNAYIASLNAQATEHLAAPTPAPVEKAVQVEPDGDWFAYDNGRRACVNIGETPDEFAAALSRQGRPGTVAKYENGMAMIYVPALGDRQPVTMLANGEKGCTKLMQMANMMGN